MFGPADGLADSAAAEATFAVLVTATRRARDEGWLAADTDPVGAATGMWGSAHGHVALALAEALPREALATPLPAAVVAVFVGFGAERDAARRSVEAAWPSVSELAPTRRVPLGDVRYHPTCPPPASSYRGRSRASAVAVRA